MNALIVVLVVIAGLFVVIYNRIITLINNRKQAFSDIDVQMKLRYDLIPNLVETVKGYAAHEKDTLDKITSLRADAMKAGSLSEKAAKESALVGSLHGLFAVAEQYPDLKANQNFLSLQQELSDIENKIAAARRFFNNATKEYNSTIGSFPNNLLCKVFGFHEEKFFDVGDEKSVIDQPVDIKI
ncbi:MAG: LemA family protein [Candidatus Gracilibacteria bacterium]